MGNYGGGAHTSDHLALGPDRVRRPVDLLFPCGPSAAFVAFRAFLLAAAVCRGSRRLRRMTRHPNAPQRRARASICAGRQGS